ncbi:hypothetical protein LPN01_17470 [Sphingomonas sp. A2-49]|uniref:hypothetical protein n=1 Tax=Sphingomonas sp. A2-49 TaxID=1391375 RepID=UPI0021CF4570|nr:hypothetical protein [Sphingomonas sp. A2-49]MCU6455871.1 hypothetical protein [Sphingomonas sp. A2-49]
MRDIFFGRLAASGDVAASAAAIGLTVAQVRHPLRTDAAFARQWEEATRAGYRLLETRLVGYLLAGGEAQRGPDGTPSLGSADWDRAIKLLALDRAGRADRGRAKTSGPDAASRDDTDRVILGKLAAFAAGKRAAAVPIEVVGA